MDFFVPGASAEEAEQVYTALAELCGVPVPELGKRIESITFRHDGEDWTATVGQRLSGTRTERKRRQGRMRDITTRLSDSATVHAIFAGIPYMVVTDAKPLGKVSSAWVNPLFAGEHPGSPTSTRRSRLTRRVPALTSLRGSWVFVP